MMMLPGLLLVQERQEAILADSSSSDITSTSMTECVNRSRSMVGFLASASWGTRGSWGTSDVAISATTVAYRSVWIMVFSSVFFDTCYVLALSSAITRSSAYVS